MLLALLPRRLALGRRPAAHPKHDGAAPCVPRPERAARQHPHARQAVVQPRRRRLLPALLHRPLGPVALLRPPLHRLPRHHDPSAHRGRAFALGFADQDEDPRGVALGARVRGASRVRGERGVGVGDEKHALAPALLARLPVLGGPGRTGRSGQAAAALRGRDRVFPALDVRQDVGRGVPRGHAPLCLVEAREGDEAGRDPRPTPVRDLDRARDRDDLVSVGPRDRPGKDHRRRPAFRGRLRLADGDRRDGDPPLSRVDRVAGEPAADLSPLGGRSAQGLDVSRVASDRGRRVVDVEEPRGGVSAALGPPRPVCVCLLPADGGAGARLRDDLLHADHVGGRPLHLPADDQHHRTSMCRGDDVV